MIGGQEKDAIRLRHSQQHSPQRRAEWVTFDKVCYARSANVTTARHMTARQNISADTREYNYRLQFANLARPAPISGAATNPATMVMSSKCGHWGQPPRHQDTQFSNFFSSCLCVFVAVLTNSLNQNETNHSAVNIIKNAAILKINVRVSVQVGYREDAVALARVAT